MPQAVTPRVSDMAVGVAGARPWGQGVGNLPTNAVTPVRSVHGAAGAVRYVSDAPYQEPYNERTTCVGTRKDGSACKAKHSPGHLTCKAHLDQE